MRSHPNEIGSRLYLDAWGRNRSIPQSALLASLAGSEL